MQDSLLCPHALSGRITLLLSSVTCLCLCTPCLTICDVPRWPRGNRVYADFCLVHGPQKLITKQSCGTSAARLTPLTLRFRGRLMGVMRAWGFSRLNSSHGMRSPAKGSPCWSLRSFMLARTSAPQLRRPHPLSFCRIAPRLGQHMPRRLVVQWGRIDGGSSVAPGCGFRGRR